ncbi:MAG: hypothetical protein N3F63_01890 [Thermoplasmata archaeon]|nr:hypothetical protein [Thermoplasmata archaeon]
MDVVLPVTRIVLYKHGVGYFERRGKVAGERQVRLFFKKEMMNDILKSLSVFCLGKGQISSISYETPEDISKLIEEKAVKVPEREALVGLFRQLKGYSVEIQTNTETVKGKVMGTEEPKQEGEKIMVQGTINERRFVVLYCEDGSVRSVDADKIVAYRILDAEASDDLQFFLEAITSERKKNMRGVTVFVDTENMELAVSYIAQMPSWRVSYRIVHEKEKAFIFGWGHIDNVLDEDLKDIKVCLVAGKPISFIYDIYTPPYVFRPTVKEEARGVKGPIELETKREELVQEEFAAEAAYKEEAPPPAASADYEAMPMEARRAPAGGKRLRSAEIPPEPTAQVLSASAPVKTQTVEMGEFFKYEILHPITVKRRQSAMVPIIQSEVGLVKEHVYNRQKNSRNPMVTMRGKNTTGLVLERGPAVVVDEGTYVGEAILPYTVPDGEIQIPYSIDMGVVVTENIRTVSVFKGLRIENVYLVRENYEDVVTEYTVENKNNEAINLVIEHPKDERYELVDTPKPTEETESYYRWKSSVKGKTQTKFEVKQRRVISYSEEIRHLSVSTLEWYLNENKIGKQDYEWMRRIIELQASINERRNRIAKMDDEYNRIFVDQERIRQNIQALHTEGKEAAMRQRYVETLGKQEDRLNEILREKEKLNKEIEKVDEEIHALLNKKGKILAFGK